MPFDREGAKAAGYSDAEIDTYLGQQPDQGVTAPDQPGDVNPLVPIGITTGGLAAGGYGVARLAGAVRRSPALGKVLAKIAARRTPIVGDVMDAAEVANAMRGGAPADVTAQPSMRARVAPKGNKVIPISRGKTGAKAKAKPPAGSVAARAEASATPSETSTENPNAELYRTASKPSEAYSRHDIGYYSQSRKINVPIEDMPQTHLLNAYKRLSTELQDAKTPAPKKLSEFKAIQAELKHRSGLAGGSSVFETPKKGDLAKQRIEVAKLIAEGPAMEAPAGSAAARAAAGRASSKALGEAAGGMAAFAPQAEEMVLSQFPGYREMKAEQELVSAAQDYYGPHTWNAASPDAQRNLVLNYAKRFHPELTVRSYQQPQGF